MRSETSDCRVRLGHRLARVAVAAVVSVAVPLVSTVATPSASASSNSTRTLPRLGDRGDGVRALQRALIAAGITVKGGADGVFGQSTLSALTTFQTARGLVPSGELDPTTAFLLGLGSAPTLPKRGDRGPAVTALQNALVSAGVTVKGGVDGIFGAGTTAAVATFQAARNLGSSGVLDVATGIALRIVPGTGTTPTTAAPVATTTAPTTTAPTTTAPTTPAPGVANLNVGQQGDVVRTLQRALIAAGIKVNGGADGVFGAATTAAVANYQRAMSIAATGVVDTLTAQFLGLLPAPAMPVFGDTGPAVVDLQNRLIGAGITVKGGADGAFGVATRVSIRAFQTARAIPVTGKVDLRTAVQLGVVPGLVTNQAPPTTPSSTPPTTQPVTTTSISVFPVLGPCWFSDTWGVPRAGGRRHEGVDIIARTGQPLYAVVDGTITRQFFDRPGSLGGNALRLTAADGTYFHYAHLSAFAEGVGLDSVVVAGQIIGYVGSTGSSSAPHLHFEYHPGGGAAVNPYPIVKAVDACRVATPPTTTATTTIPVVANPTNPA